jgi:autotransporter-associated beta strand protein
MSQFKARVKVPPFRVFTGNGANNNWSTPENWVNLFNGAVAAPVAGTPLMFLGPNRLATNSNDLTATTRIDVIIFIPGAGAFTLSGNSITIDGEIVNISLNLQTINLDMALATRLKVDANKANIAIGGILSGAGGLAKSGSQRLTLSGNNTYAGGTSINGGVIFATTSNNALSNTGTITINPGATRLLIQDLRTIARPIVINGGAPGAGRGLIENSGNAFVNLNGAITINGSTIDGVHLGSFSLSGGLLTINNTITAIVPVTVRGFIIFAAAGSNYTSIVVTEGQLRITANNAVATNATVTLATVGDATLALSGRNQSLVGLTKGSFVAIVGNISDAADATLTLTGESKWAGVIQDALFGTTKKVLVVINSSGTVTFSGANTYTGATTISGGTLLLTGSLGNTPVSVNAGGTLAGPNTVGGSATITGTVTVADSSTAVIKPGAPGDNTLNTGALTFSGANSKMIANSTASTFSKIAVTGDVALGGCTIDFEAGITTNGTYKLITATGTMSGTLPTVGANATGKSLLLQQTGNDLEVVVS